MQWYLDRGSEPSMPGWCLPLAPECSGHEQASPLAPHMQSGVLLQCIVIATCHHKYQHTFWLCNRWRGVA
eukprot:12903575-Prorocentrum_lima.AAC.1